MSSTALSNLLAGLLEIDALQRANPSPIEGSGLKRPDIVRALGRSEVVLLSSHFERYVYDLVEEAVQQILISSPKAENIPLRLRLQHSKAPVDELAETAWPHREQKLRDFASTDAALWQQDGQVTTFDHDRLLKAMKAPHSRELVKAFGMWGIADIFTAITRTKHTRNDLWLRIGELVEKRNAIAHGDLTVEATHLDIKRYKSAVKTFCERADAKMSAILVSICGATERPW